MHILYSIIMLFMFNKSRIESSYRDSVELIAFVLIGNFTQRLLPKARYFPLEGNLQIRSSQINAPRRRLNIYCVYYGHEINKSRPEIELGAQNTRRYYITKRRQKIYSAFDIWGHEITEENLELVDLLNFYYVIQNSYI